MRVLKHPLFPYAACLLIVLLWAASRLDGPLPARAASGRGVAGHVTDPHGEPVERAHLRLFVNGDVEPVSEAESQPDGAYLLTLPITRPVSAVRMEVERPHFETYVWQPTAQELSTLLEQGSFVTHEVLLTRRINASFWVTVVIFALMLIVIAAEKLHNTLAALLAVAAVMTVSLVGGTITPELYVFDFEHALEHIDFEVIFLLMGMMIVIGVIEETGIFQWMAFQAYRLSRGRVWLLTAILMGITTVTAALLDNVTTMLLITPITLEIALAVGINPLSLLIPALLAANTGGLATLVGTPVNIMVGSYAGLGFNDFLFNLTPGVILALAGLMIFVLIRYRKEHRASGKKLSKALLKRLENDGRIRDRKKLIKSGIVFGGLLLLFIFGSPLNLTPAVSAIIGAVVMLLWVNPDIKAMLGVVDWTTLVFFIGLFIVVGAVEEVGLLMLIADGISALVAGSPLAALLVIIWAAAIFSGVVDNIPFAAAMLPVAGFLTRTIPGVNGPMLYYGLALGADLGGNITLLGSSANLVVAGIAERAGYPISFRKFIVVGLPATLITTALGTLWLVVHFVR